MEENNTTDEQTYNLLALFCFDRFAVFVLPVFLFLRSTLLPARDPPVGYLPMLLCEENEMPEILK